MKKRLKEMEEEAAALREMQAKVEKEMGAVQGLHPYIFFFFNYLLFEEILRCGACFLSFKSYFRSFWCGCISSEQGRS